MHCLTRQCGLADVNRSYGRWEPAKLVLGFELLNLLITNNLRWLPIVDSLLASPYRTKWRGRRFGVRDWPTMRKSPPPKTAMGFLSSRVEATRRLLNFF